jgi:hypothetical protein
MNEGEIRAAMERMRERKEAVGLSAENPAVEGTLKDAAELIGRIFSGLDLEPLELLEQGENVRESSWMAVLLGVAPPGQIAAACWLDGLGVGLLIAERRARERTAE